MAKGYWISAYRVIHDPDKLAAYAKLAGPAVVGAGGHFLVRGPAAKAHGAGVAGRTVVIEYESLEKALAAYETPAYKDALAALGDGVERDFRIVEGAE